MRLPATSNSLKIVIYDGKMFCNHRRIPFSSSVYLYCKNQSQGLTFFSSSCLCCSAVHWYPNLPNNHTKTLKRHHLGVTVEDTNYYCVEEIFLPKIISNLQMSLLFWVLKVIKSQKHFLLKLHCPK